MTTWPSGLRRVTRNHFSSGGVGSNPAVVVFYILLLLYNTCNHLKNGPTQIRTGVPRTRISYAAPTPWNLSTWLFFSTVLFLLFFPFLLKKDKGTIGFEPMTAGTAVLRSTTELCALLRPSFLFLSLPSANSHYLSWLDSAADNVAEWFKACD